MAQLLLPDDLAALGSLLATLLFWTALVNSGGFFRFLRVFRALHPASWPPIITWMGRFAWMLWLLAAVSFVVLRLRYPVGGDITLSPNVPLMEHVLQVLALGGIVGSSIILWVWMFATQIHGAAVRSRGHDAAMWQQLSQRRGQVAWGIVFLIMTLVVAAAGAFLIINVVMIINLLGPF